MKLLKVFTVLLAVFVVLGSAAAQDAGEVEAENESWIPVENSKWIELHQRWLELRGIEAPTRISGVSPFTDCVADAPDLQLGEVFVGSEVEAWVAVNPQYPKNIVATWQQDRWSNGGARGLVTGVSFDGGEHWLIVPLPRLTPCTGGEFERASDPWLTFAPNGDLYHIALEAGHSLIEFLEGESDAGRSGMVVQKSTDGGLTWSDPITLIDEMFAGLNDKQSITADPHDSDFVYAVWDRFAEESDFAKGPALFSRTTNGGITWEAPRVLYDPGPNRQTLANQLVVLPDGTLIDFFTNIESEENSESYHLVLKRSPDRGETWLPDGEPIVVSSMEPSLNLSDPDLDMPIRGGGALFDVAVDPRRGTIYAVWEDARFSGSGDVVISEDGDVVRVDHQSIALVVSEDGGFTWTEPVKINRTPTYIPTADQQAFLPSVAVNRRGVVAVTYYDFRFNGEEPGAMIDYWAVVFEPAHLFGGVHYAGWSEEIRLTGESFDLLNAPVAGGLFLGDYAGLASEDDTFTAVFAKASLTDSADVFSSRFKKGYGVLDRQVLSTSKRTGKMGAESEFKQKRSQRTQGTF